MTREKSEIEKKFAEEEATARFEAAKDALAVGMKDIEAAFQELCVRAAALSEEHGVPVEFAGDTYVPHSIVDHFGDGETVWDMFTDELYDYRYGGELPIGDWWSPSTC